MPVDLVGPKGWEHNWHAIRPPATLVAAGRKFNALAAGSQIARGEGAFKLPTGKASESTAGRKALLKAGHALPPSKPGGRPGYPIGDAKHWDKAFKAVGRSGGGARRAALAKLLRKTAGEFGKTGKIKGSWLDMSNLVDLVGPKGYVHGWVYLGPEATATRAVLEHHMANYHGGNPGVGGHRIGPRRLTIKQLRARHDEMHQLGQLGVGHYHPEHKTAAGGRMNMSNVLNLARMTCPNCGYADDDAAFSQTNDSGDTTQMPSALGTPDPTRGLGSTQAAAGFNSSQYGVRGASSGSYGSLSNQAGRVLDLSRRLPVATAMDILISRGEGGRAVVRHRRGGGPIGEIYRNEQGQWVSALDGGKTLAPHTQQRAAVVDLITTYNGGVGNAYHRPSEPQSLIPRPEQTPLMQRYGIPAATVLATPMNGSSDGPRVTKSDGDSDDDLAGLTPRGVTIYKKLKARGFPAERALAFARRSQNFGGSKGS